MRPAESLAVPSPGRQAIAVLRYPVQSASLTTLLALSLSLVLTIAPLVGIVVLLVIWASACRYAVEVLERSANGSLQAPEFATEPDGMGWTLLILQALFLVSHLWLSYRVETAELRWLGYAVIACVQPAMIVTAAMSGNLGAALNPARLLRVIGRLDMAYVLLVIASGVLGSVQRVLTEWIGDSLPTVLGQMLSGFIWFYLMVLYFHVLGRLVYAYRKELGFVPIPETTLRPEDRHAPVLARVERLAADGDSVGAAQVLHGCLSSEPYTSPAMHARYRELLTTLDDRAGLLSHAQMQLHELLARGAEHEALRMLRESLACDPQFRPASPDQTTQLARVAERLGQNDLALALLQDFQVRNPRDPEIPANALIAARLLVERHSDVDAALALLHAAAEHFPEHPAHAELLVQGAKLDLLSSRLPGKAAPSAC